MEESSITLTPSQVQHLRQLEGQSIGLAQALRDLQAERERFLRYILVEHGQLNGNWSLSPDGVALLQAAASSPDKPVGGQVG